jgi:hypothetical protein
MPRADPNRKRCAIYTRKSSEEGLEQEFNSLEAQHEACEAYIRSQRHEGWASARTRYDDGGFSGGNIERPALQRLLADIGAGRVRADLVERWAQLASHKSSCWLAGGHRLSHRWLVADYPAGRKSESAASRGPWQEPPIPSAWKSGPSVR